MAYIVPSVLVFEDFQASPVAIATPLQAHIAGGNGLLVRYAQSAERESGNIGTYDPLDDKTVDWPNRPAGGVIDQSYTKLFVKNAILRYFDSGSDGVTDLVKVAGKTNEIGSPTFNFKTNGANPRDAALIDRDVQLGDIVKIRWASTPPITQWTYVNGFDPDPVAAAISASVSDAGNQATGGASAVGSQTRGPFNAVHISAASAAAYDPFPTGKVDETYTLIVTSSSIDGDFTTATLRVISASGLDDQAQIVPNAKGVPTPIGTHGVTATFALVTGGAGTTDSDSAIAQGVSPDDLIVGQRFQVVAHAAFTAPVSQANDTALHATTAYTGATDTTYIVTVTKGNKYATAPAQITVTTTTGVDISGPTNVTTAATYVAVGRHGVTIQFTGAGLALGDRYYVPVSAKSQGRVGTIILGNTVSSDVPDGTGGELQLFIKKDALEVDQNRIGYAPLTNFDQAEETITVHGGIIGYDPTWTDLGVMQPLSLEADAGQGYSTVYVQTRTWVQDFALAVNGISDPGTLNVIPGALDPDNPLKWGLFEALTNANGTTVMYTAVSDPSDTANWDAVLGILTGHDNVYGLVPLSKNPIVQQLYQGHVDDQSSPDNGQWRTAWFNLSGVPTIPIVSNGSTVAGYLESTTTDGAVALATISADPDAVGNPFTIVTVPSGNAQFLTNGVKAGDIVRAFFSEDGFGNVTYNEYVVDVVTSEDTLRLLSGPPVAVTVAAQTEVWRNLNATDEAAAIAKIAGAFADRRIRAVWPDTIESAGTVMDGTFLCCSLAALSGGIVPQQGMTNLQILGYDAVPRTTRKFNSAQLNVMAGSGVWIVTQNPAGTVYTRHAVTTGAYVDINQREEMITRNVDSIAYNFKVAFQPYIGVCNVTPSMQLLLGAVIDRVIANLSITYSNVLGPQLITATIVSFRPSLTFADRYVLVLNITVPAPFNNFEIHLVV